MKTDRRRRRDRPAWLTHNLIILSWVSFLQDTASELLYPILPIFLTVTLGAPALAVGMIESLGSGIAALVSPFSGRFADRVRKRPLVGAGYGLAAAGKTVVALAGGWPVVLLGRCVDRVGKGVRGAPRDALIIDAVAPNERGRAFGFHRAADTAGAVVGPLLGLAGYEIFHHHIRPLLWLAVPPAILSTVLVIAVKETKRTVTVAVRREDADPATVPADSPLPRRFWKVALLLTAFAIVNFPDALLLLRLKAIGFSTAMVILAYVGYNVVYTLLSYPAGALSDHFAKSRVYGVGLVFFAIGYLGLGLTRNHLAAWLILGAYGAFTACTDGVGKAWVSSLVDPGHHARALGWFQGLSGGAVLMSGIWAGLAWHHTGAIPLIISGTVAAVFGLGLISMRTGSL